MAKRLSLVVKGFIPCTGQMESLEEVTIFYTRMVLSSVELVLIAAQLIIAQLSFGHQIIRLLHILHQSRLKPDFCSTSLLMPN